MLKITEFAGVTDNGSIIGVKNVNLSSTTGWNPDCITGTGWCNVCKRRCVNTNSAGILLNVDKYLENKVCTCRSLASVAGTHRIMNSAYRSASSTKRTTYTAFFNKYIIKNRVIYSEPCVSGGHSHRAFSSVLQGSTTVRGQTTVLLISALRLNVLWTKISTKWMRSATPNHHIPRYPPISSPLSALCHFEEGQMNPGRVLFWVCVFI